MDFFKSVFSEPTPTNQNPETTPPPNSSWVFGSTLLKTLTTKSESLLDNYYKDLQEFSSGLKNETSAIRQAASRAVQDLPARLESGAAIAQESLEAVGQAIDNVGSTVTEIIGKDLNFSSNDAFLNDENAITSEDYVKPYSRIEAMVRGVGCNFRTYCDEIEESGYDEWRLGFRVEDRRGEIVRLFEENGVIKEIYDEVVPGKVDEETFWCRYFYRVGKVVEAEEARARFVKKAVSREEDEEELSWDVDEYDDSDEYKSRNELKMEIKNKGKEKEKEIIKIEGEIDNNESEVGVSGTKSGGVVENEENLEEKEGSDGKIESDISIISSRRSSHVEDDEWDEIEDIGSGSPKSNPSNVVDLRKRLSVSEEDEELTWDIEDDDDETVKS